MVLGLAGFIIIGIISLSLSALYINVPTHPQTSDTGLDDSFLDALDNLVKDTVSDLEDNENITYSNVTDEFRVHLDDRLDMFISSQFTSPYILQISYDNDGANTWTTDHCPDEPGKHFGDCKVQSGVILQTRGESETVVGVAFNITRTSPDVLEEYRVVVLVDTRPVPTV